MRPAEGGESCVAGIFFVDMLDYFGKMEEDLEGGHL